MKKANTHYRPALLLMVLAVLSGCAVGNQYQYKAEEVGLPLPKHDETQDTGIMVSDNRPYVLNGDKATNFVGLQRGGFGNPFNVTTQSGRAFAEDVADVLATLLERSGYSATVKGVNQGIPNLAESLRGKALDHGIHLNILEWKTDIYASMTLHYNLELSIIDADGNVLAKSVQQGVEGVGGGSISQQKNAQTASYTLSTKLSYLFLDPQVQAALK